MVFPNDFKEEQAPYHQKSHHNSLNFLKDTLGFHIHFKIFQIARFPAPLSLWRFQIWI
ncbi:hypothetical protein HanRHA438_Chr04g0171621 [Helianthus annuus]|uniref:Uncharacterized protein n=1 Tax=Helianthus annuus TaxID=4232 RepID=A0A251UXG7_HELAN|nr:hypothetical protein HanXRQr2_Chr04g0161451 [Helianthus annuus]KAJ0580750.1 hypothetical protein HanHA300_Chr04g0132961 [Helianthus annuus]KAJ0588424.1 hypothetical protein HanIR_Chr04g0174511 [Helianthus annuus]KAJ0596698.1 hypothetical protein HanHA89_Chr04g0145911 [Helianthus annuus]KAJ0757370.1 hypothetical protein HanLR1_Chr04g0137961 [Helianthus annuus]